MHATITSAVELTATQLNTVKTAITRKHGKGVTFQTVVDPTILGGIQIVVGSKQFDGSVRNKLAQIRQHLLRSEA